VRVVPVGAGIRHIELVEELHARRDRRLREVGHAIHRVRHAQAVPVHGRLLVEAVLDDDAQALALAHPDLRARHRAVVGPDGGLGVRGADEVRAGRTCDEAVLDREAGPDRPSWHQRRDSRSAASGHKGSAGKTTEFGNLHLECTHPWMR
jgi:hypothetical protein